MQRFKQLKSKDFPINQFELLPVSASCTIRKSTDTRGIINELKETAEKADFSQAIINLFNPDSSPAPANIHIPNPPLPAVLSKAQKNAMQNGKLQKLSVIIGPPGTGKTYTIAALAAQQMLNGKSVLIASRTDTAVDVIEKKIADLLQEKHLTVRAGRKQYLRELKNFLDDILSGFVHRQEEITSRALERKIRKTENQLEKLNRNFLKLSDFQIKIGEIISRDQRGIFTMLLKAFLKFRIKQFNTLYYYISEAEKQTDSKNEQIRNYIRIKYAELTDACLKKEREELVSLFKAVKMTSGQMQQQIFNSVNFKSIFKIFPVWLVKMSDIYKVLPLTKELFDTAVIDEATQCDIASALPVIQRAKQIIITGDPKQLRHASFLSRSQQAIFADKFKLNDLSVEYLNYRENSILDICLQSIGNQKQISTLDEHFRSMPAIIRFSNKAFYKDSLRIMKANPLLKPNEGIVQIALKGTRNKSGYNKAEADFILKDIQERFTEQSSERSIGILSPFGDQADYISRRVQSDFNTEFITKHQITVGTAYAFQGEERDVMYMSCALDNQSHAMAFRHFDKPDVFNVSVTRAQSLQYIVHSLTIENLPADSLLRRYLSDIRTYENLGNETGGSYKDAFSKAVESNLNEAGYKVFIDFPAAGFNPDMVIAKGKKTAAVDLIGYPGQFADTFGTERYRILYRAGLHCFPLAYFDWQTDSAACLAAIDEFMETV